MKALALFLSAASMALGLGPTGCASTVRKCKATPLSMKLPLLMPADYEVLGTVDGYGTRLLVCGFPFGEGRYAYVNCPLSAALPEEAKQRPDVFKQNPLISDTAKLGAIIVGEFTLPFPMWIFLLEYRFSPARDAVATATYHALHKRPDADTFLPETLTVWNKGFWPLWSREYAEIQGKAIHIKTDKERLNP